MQVPRTFLAASLLVVMMVGVPLAGVAIANAARPVIPTDALVPPGGPENLPSMPEPPATVRPLADQFEKLPLVAPVSDAAPRAFLERYRAVPVDDAIAAAALIDVAFAELDVAPSDRAVTRQFLDALVLEPVDEEDPDADPDDAADEPFVGPFDTPEFQALSDRAVQAIAADPSNALALDDIAVAISTAALTDTSSFLDAPGDGPAIADSNQLMAAAIRLLELGRASFPTDRGIAINLAYLQSLAGGAGTDEEVEPEDLPDPAITAINGLQPYVDGATADPTARALFANLLVRTDLEHGLERALAVAQPLIDVPDTEAAGRIVRADSLLFAADRQRTQSPFTARSTARRALEEYDRSIELSGDAAAYIGRARVLDVLGSRDAALEAQREAVRLTPSSLTWRLRLAQLEGCMGQVDGWRRDAQEAFALAGAAQKTPIAATRYNLADLPARDYGKYSIGSDLPTLDITVRLPATGTSVSAIDPFPEPVACMSSEPAAPTAVDDATTEVALAALADDDQAAARAALTAWRNQLPVVDGEADTEATLQPAIEEVLGMLGGAAPEEDTDSIGEFLEVASRLPPNVQGRVCDQLARVPGVGPSDVDDLVVCTAEAAARTGDNAAAGRAIDAAVRLDDPTSSVSGLTALQAGMLSELNGDLGAARSRYEASATHSGTLVAGLTRLGDLDLREGDASGALDHYALAEAAIRTQGVGADLVEIDEAQAGRLGQYIDNNRGIALLMSARTEPDAAPDCTAFASLCQEAGDAFAAAQAADPLNPLYPMNAAWVARLTGDADRATALLTEALEKGIPLVAPAHNDLGVLAAGRGDIGDARAHFVQAISTDPDYDLATWNLGVLDSRQGGAMILAGQALLADATGLDPGLLTRELAFQADERVYRVEVSGTQFELARAPGTGAAIGAAAFGAIATVGAIGQLISGMGGDVQSAAETVAGEGLGRAGRRLRGLGSRSPLAGRRWPSWAAWIPAIAVLIVTTAWTAAWMAPDAFLTAVLIGLAAAVVAMVVHACGHLVVARRLGAKVQASGWTPGLGLAVVGMPFHVPAGPFLAERIETGDPRRDWWASFAGVAANLAAAGIALLIYLSEPMPFLRILIATQLAVAAFALIPSDPLDGGRLARHPIVLALLAFGVAAASTALAVGAI